MNKTCRYIVEVDNPTEYHFSGDNSNIELVLMMGV